MVQRITLLVGVACSVTALFVAGFDGLAGGVLGTALVVGFFATGRMPVLATEQARAGVAAGLGLLLLTFTLRLAVALIVLRVTDEVGFIDQGWVGATIIVCGLTYPAVHIALAIRGPATPLDVPTPRVDAPDPDTGPDFTSRETTK